MMTTILLRTCVEMDADEAERGGCIKFLVPEMYSAVRVNASIDEDKKKAVAPAK